MSLRNDLAAAVLLAVVLAACPTPPLPTPTPIPDASDAAPTPIAADAGTSASCVAACLALQTAGCVVLDDCALALTSDLGPTGIVRNPVTGKALTCDDVAKVKSASDAQQLGQPCGPPQSPSASKPSRPSLDASAGR